MSETTGGLPILASYGILENDHLRADSPTATARFPTSLVKRRRRQAEKDLKVPTTDVRTLRQPRESCSKRTMSLWYASSLCRRNGSALPGQRNHARASRRTILNGELPRTRSDFYRPESDAKGNATSGFDGKGSLR